jgi:anti-sigma factor RsiW
MGCDLWGEKLDANFDGELPPEEARALSEHLRQCPRCAADGIAKVQQKLAVRAAGQRFVPDPAFRSRIQKMVSARKPLLWTRWLPTLAAAAVLLIVATFLIFTRGRSADHQLLSELTDLHVATLASSNPVDVVSSDRHTVKPWFEGKIPFTFNLPELQDSPYVLVGGKVAYLNRSPGAELIFRLRQHQISLFIFQDHTLANEPAGNESLTAFSFSIRTWSSNGLRYFLVGDVSAQDLDKLATIIKATNWGSF